jgi:hypothetical protein
MESLNRKAYWEQFQPTPQFVFTFPPGEMPLGAARARPRAARARVKNNVIPATLFTLIALRASLTAGRSASRRTPGDQLASHEPTSASAPYDTSRASAATPRRHAFNKSIDRDPPARHRAGSDPGRVRRTTCRLDRRRDTVRDEEGAAAARRERHGDSGA